MAESTPSSPAIPSGVIPSGAPAPSELDHDALERYVQDRFAAEDDVLRRVRARADRAGMPRIQLPPVTARAVQLLVRTVGARKVVEVGTLAGYSAIWIARALPPSGRLVTIEVDAAHVEVARRSVADAGLANRVEIRLGAAAEALDGMTDDGSLDVVFLDADKPSYDAYRRQAARLLRPGGLLLADNALWRGRVLDPGDDESAEHLARFNDAVAADARFDATILPVGDGLMVAVRL